MIHGFNRCFSVMGSAIFQMALIVFIISSCGNTKSENKTTDVAKVSIGSNKVTNAANAKTKYAEVKGRKIAYRSIGEGTPMILCLRFRGNMDSWDPAFLDQLAKNYRVVVFDYSGFGLSTGAPATDIMGFANDVKDLATALNIQKFVVGGWSFGGAVAQIVTTEMPQLVSHTILIGTRPPGKFKHLPEQIFHETSSKAINDLNDEIILFFEPSSEISKQKAKLSHDRIASRTTDNDVYIKQELWPNYVMGFTDFEKDPYNARQKLAQTNIPVLVISADHEVVFPPQNWFELNRQTASVQLVVIPQTGHGPQHQYPEMVASYIHAFIQNQ